MTERDLMFLIAVVIVGGTLVVFLMNWWRGRGRGDDMPRGPRDDGHDSRGPHDGGRE